MCVFMHGNNPVLVCVVTASQRSVFRPNKAYSNPLVSSSSFPAYLPFPTHDLLTPPPPQLEWHCCCFGAVVAVAPAAAAAVVIVAAAAAAATAAA